MSGHDAKEEVKGPSILSILPTELIDRILQATFDLSKTTTTASLTSSIRFLEACKLSQVNRTFHALIQPKMYKQVSISVRQIPAFLITIQNNKDIARYIKDMTLEGRIWTDIDQDVVIGILLSVRQSCIRVRLGATESMLLPYLLHGSSAGQEIVEKQDVEDISSTCALQVLHICWRDEIKVQSQWQHLNQVTQHKDSADTLYHLFQHRQEVSIPSICLPQQPLPRLTHLTLDLYSQAQLDQIFDINGYFVKSLLPKLVFLRIEMPLVVLQFSCHEAGDLVQGWPKDDWLTNFISVETVQEAIDDRQDHTRRVTATAYHHHQENDTRERRLQEEEEDMIMPYCPANQVKSLTLRFLLNVHRNDMMLFQLTCPLKALEQSWSTRASVAAHCLSSTMQMYLNKPFSSIDNTEDKRSRICSFPFAQYKNKGAEVYWKQKWAEAEADCSASLPSEIRPPTSVSFHNKHKADDENSQSTKVSLLLKWPNAVDAFFHYSAMT